MSDEWFILRTSGRSTLVLAKTLELDGYGVWTPARTITMRVPRMNVRREVTLPLLPSFVFARSEHLGELLAMARQPVKHRAVQPTGEARAHRDFTIFHYLDSIPMIADRHLEPLRAKEREAIPKRSRPTFEKGIGGRLNSGAFEGLKGRVERCKSGYALVIFTDWKRPVQIPTFLLAEEPGENIRRRIGGNG